MKGSWIASGVIIGTAAFSVALAAAPHRSPPRATSSATVSTKTLPVFSFMGNTTGEQAALPADCSTSGDISTCDAYSNPSIAGTNVEFISRSFYKGRLYRVVSDFHDWAYLKLLSAFEEKYGKPDATERRKWQSKGGATFDNEVAIWHFKGGDLELQTMGGSVDEGRFVFVSTENSPPAEKAKVDF